MKRIITIISAFLLIALTSVSGQNKTRIVENFDFDWKFSKIDLPELPTPVRTGPGGERMGPPPERVDTILESEKGLEAVDFDDSSWETVQAPHDWNIKDKFDIRSSGSAASLPEGIGWYRKTFTVPASMKGKEVEIIFDGIFQKSDVYINGHHLGTHPYGYSTVHYVMTPYIKFGEENVIAVRSSTVGGRPRWYGGGGIYRHVDLIYTNPVHVDTYGTYITTPEVSKEVATVNIVTTVKNASQKAQNVTLVQKIINAAGAVVAEKKGAVATIGASEKADISVSLELENPMLWDIDNPNMYTMETTVKLGSKTVDNYTTPFGVRTIAFDSNKGFFLNGESVKLKGVCLHQCAGGLGVAVPDRSYERRLEILKEYGCNAIRMAHNQPSRELLDMCDRMGFLVIDEALDKWKSGYYEALFDQWWQKDLEDMILRDRNHPSIILWSIGNEVSEAWLETNEGYDRARMLQDFVHSIEPSRLVIVSCQNNHEAHFASATDVVGYNYLEARMIAEHEIYPERIMMVTEELPYWSGEEGNIRSYTPYNPWNYVKEHDFIAGGFIWSGVDYLGEASAGSKGWPNGLFDICMFEKPRAAYHRAMWNDEPIVRIAIADNSLDEDFGRDIWQWPSLTTNWNYPRSYNGKMMQVQTITNCDEVELYQNGNKMGRHKTSDFSNNTIIWNLPYRDGKLEAKGFIDGEEVAYFEISTTGPVAELAVIPDVETIKSDGQDLSHITIELRDAEGRIVQNDDREVYVKVSGEGRLLAVDNGDLRVQTDSFDRDHVKTQNGKALAIVQSTRNSGAITVQVFMEGSSELKTLTIMTK